MVAVTWRTISDKARPTSVTRRLNALKDPSVLSPPSSGRENEARVVTVKKKIVVSRTAYNSRLMITAEYTRRESLCDQHRKRERGDPRLSLFLLRLCSFFLFRRLPFTPLKTA